MSARSCREVFTYEIREIPSHYEWDYVGTQDKPYATFSFVDVSKDELLSKTPPVAKARSEPQALPRLEENIFDEFDDDTLLDEDFPAF